MDRIRFRVEQKIAQQSGGDLGRKQFLQDEREKLVPKYKEQIRTEIEKYKREQRIKVEAAFAKLQQDFEKKRGRI